MDSSAPGGPWPPQPGVVYQAPLTGYAPPPTVRGTHPDLAARAASAEAAIDGLQHFAEQPLDRTPFRRACEVWGCEALAYRSRVPDDVEFPYLFTCDDGHEIPSAPDWG